MMTVRRSLAQARPATDLDETDDDDGEEDDAQAIEPSPARQRWDQQRLPFSEEANRAEPEPHILATCFAVQVALRERETALKEELKSVKGRLKASEQLLAKLGMRYVAHHPVVLTRELVFGEE